MLSAHYAKQHAHRLAAPVDVLSNAVVAPARMPLPPLHLLPHAVLEVVAPLEEADLSATALPVAERPASNRPTDTTWSGEVL